MGTNYKPRTCCCNTARKPSEKKRILNDTDYRQIMRNEYQQFCCLSATYSLFFLGFVLIFDAPLLLLSFHLLCSQNSIWKCDNDFHQNSIILNVLFFFSLLRLLLSLSSFFRAIRIHCAAIGDLYSTKRIRRNSRQHIIK